MFEMAGSGLALLILLVVFTNQTLGQFDTTEHPGEECLPFDGSLSPRCAEYVDPTTLEPVFIQHQWNCSRFWICGPDLEHCLFECAPTPDGGNLYFDVRIQYPLGPVCDWPEVIDCNMGTSPSPTTAPPCNCEPWQECNQGVCSPDCKIDDHCEDIEYCDFEEGGTGICKPGCRNGADCGKCGDCVAHLCQEPQCCTDADCEANQTCEGGLCKFECIVDADCASTEYCDTDHSCKVGCRNDDGCPGCATCESHECSKPDCCVDADCLNDDKPLCEDNVCMAGCREHEDCPGYDDVCNVLYDNCNWCNNTDTEIGQCNPGCIDNSNCAGGQECDGSHNCINPGVTVLKTIILETGTCSGCSGGKVEAGAWLSLTGKKGSGTEAPTCTTLVLDHPDTVDYAAGNAAVFDTANTADQEMMSTCFKANLHVGITEGKVTWTAAAGEWTPANKQITLKWSDAGLAPLCCCLDQATLSPSSPTAQITSCEESNEPINC